ncbi:hypothetical protein ACIBL8_24380 [Streptomyces sp. NPDC050523]|uniref:hypothetical protein n=1 Tax=Streptomyces sp. NPDC050523 TaxID=3365622 RepID=UPI003796AD11
MIHATSHVSSTLGPLFTIVMGAGLILVAVRYLGKLPLFCAESLARIASEHRWVLAVYLGTVFIALPALVIVFVGVL